MKTSTYHPAMKNVGDGYECDASKTFKIYLPFANAPVGVAHRLILRRANLCESDEFTIVHVPTGMTMGRRTFTKRKSAMAIVERLNLTDPVWALEKPTDVQRRAMFDEFVQANKAA